jgi:hypothetical protein
MGEKDWVFVVSMLPILLVIVAWVIATKIKNAKSKSQSAKHD